MKLRTGSITLALALALTLALTLLATPAVFAGPLYSTTATMIGVNGASIDGVFTGPYYITIDGQQYAAFCDDYPDHVSIGQTWDVDVYSGDNPIGAYFTPMQYQDIFALAELAYLPGSDQISLQQAIWRVTDPAYTSGPIITSYPAYDPADYLIISGHGAPGERPQEFIVRRAGGTPVLTGGGGSPVPIPVAPTPSPEPSTWVFALVGIAILACLRWRRMGPMAVLASILICFQTVPAQAANWTMIRRIGQAAGCAASMIDAGSTLRPGMMESNPVLGRGRPQAARVIGIKVGMCAGQIVYAEWRLHRLAGTGTGNTENYHEMSGAILGYSQAGMFSWAAAHNMRAYRAGAAYHVRD